jgi:hypothetical protein
MTAPASAMKPAATMPAAEALAPVETISLRPARAPRCGRPLSYITGMCGRKEGHPGYCRSTEQVRRDNERIRARRAGTAAPAARPWELKKQRDPKAARRRGPIKGADARKAAVVIASRAVDAADCRELLEACGLLEYAPGRRRRYTFGEAA